MDSNCLNLDPPRQIRHIAPTRCGIAGIHAFRGQFAVPFDSTLERDFLIRLEFDRRATKVIPQPFDIPFINHLGEPDVYTPDFLVLYGTDAISTADTQRPLIVDVKFKEEWHSYWHNWAGKWKSARRFARSNGFQFRIQDESRIRDQVFCNIRLLDRYKRMNFTFKVADHIQDYLRRHTVCTVQQVASDCLTGLPAPVGGAYVRHLIANRLIDCDLTVPLSDQSRVWVASNG